MEDGVVLEKAVGLLLRGKVEEARLWLRRLSVTDPVERPLMDVQRADVRPARTPRIPVTAKTAAEVLKRDGWQYCYCGRRVVASGVITLVGELFPSEFPFPSHAMLEEGLTLRPSVSIRMPTTFTRRHSAARRTAARGGRVRGRPQGLHGARARRRQRRYTSPVEVEARAADNMQRFADYLARGDSSARIEQLDGAAEERDHDDLARQLAALMPDELERLLAQVQTGAL